MSYTPLATVVTGETWTAGNHNTFFKDNFAAGVPDIFTTLGDIAIASAQDVAGVLPVGSDGEVLKVSSTDTLGVAWGASVLNALAAAAGDMILASGAGAFATLSAGVDKQFLSSSSTDTNGVAWKPIIPQRQGGSATDWSADTTDTTNHTLTAPVIQIGVKQITFTGDPATATDTITYPTAYSEPPLIFLGGGLVANTTKENSLNYNAVTTSDFGILINVNMPTSDISGGTMDLPWLSIGAP